VPRSLEHCSTVKFGYVGNVELSCSEGLLQMENRDCKAMPCKSGKPIELKRLDVRIRSLLESHGLSWSQAYKSIGTTDYCNVDLGFV